MPNKNINKKLITEDDDEDNDLIINNDDDFCTEIDQNQNKEELLQKKINEPSPKVPDSLSSQKIEKTIESNNIEKSSNNNMFKPAQDVSNSNMNENEKEVINEDKTIFSKIAEDIYLDNRSYLMPKKLYFDISKAEEDNYNKLTIENYLFTCADRENSKNNKIISSFLERKTKEQNNKKIGSDPEKDDLENLAEIKGNVFSESKKDKLKKNNYRSPEQFIKEQKILEEKHKEYINKLIKLHHEESKNTIKDRPTISKKSEIIANMKKGGNKNNKEIHMKLYEDFNIKKQKKEEIINNAKKLSDNKFKKLKREEIIQNSKRLYQDYAKRKNTYNENNIKQLKDIMSMSAVSLIEKKSNIIIFKKLINKYKDEINSIFNKNAWDKFELNYNDYLKLIFKIGCVEKDYNYNDTKNNEIKNPLNNNNKNNSKNNDEPEQINHIKNKIMFSKNILKKNIFIKSKSPERNKFNEELDLIKNSWKIITKNKDFSAETKANSHRVLLFFLSLYGIYKGDLNDNLIKKEFPSLSENIDKNENIDETTSKQIYKCFQMFRNSAINYFSIKNKEKPQELEKKLKIIKFKKGRVTKESKSFVKTIDYSYINDDKRKQYFSTSKSAKRIKYIQTIKKNVNKNKTSNEKIDNNKKDFKDTENKEIKDNKEIKEKVTKEVNNNSIIKDEDSIPKSKINNNNGNLIVNKLKKNLKPKYEIKRKKLNLNKGQTSNSTKNINLKTNKYIISNENNTSSQKNIKANMNEKKANIKNNNITNYTSKPYEIISNQNQNQKIIQNNKNIHMPLPKVQTNNASKILEEKKLLNENKNIGKEQNINKDNTKHQKEKNSSISNYIFNEDYRIKEDIETNSALNNLEENEINENKKIKNNEENINKEKKIENNSELKEKNIIKNNINENNNMIEQKENNKNEKKKKSKFVFKIKIKNKMIKLIINKGDDIEIKIDEFCKENNLDEDDKKEILDAIKSNMN